MSFEKNDATSICTVLRSAGFQAVFAGGCVRDRLIGIDPNDYDIATNATPEDIKKLFFNSVEVGKAFGVVLVKMGQSKCEVATFRIDGTYSDGRRPDSVEFSTMEEDARRRDFTMNAMFYDPVSNQYHDFVNGMIDIINKTLRFVGNPYERIQEDHLRIMRAIRFAVKYDLKYEKKTEKALQEKSYLLSYLPKERIVQEFNKILELGKPTLAIKSLLKFGIMNHIIPKVVELDGCEQDPIWHPEGSVLTHTLIAMENLVESGHVDYKMQLACLLHDIGKPETKNIYDSGRISNHGHDKAGENYVKEVLTELKYSNKDIEFVSELVGHHMRIKKMKEMKLSKKIRMLSHPFINEIISLSDADTKACLGADYEAEIGFIQEVVNSLKDEVEKKVKLPDPLITGKDLIDAGLKPGKMFSEILRNLSDMQLDGDITTKKEAIDYVMNYIIDPDRD